MSDDKSQPNRDEEEASSEELAVPESRAAAEALDVDFDGGAPANLGSLKYVHAAFFGAGVLLSYVAGKTLAALWNTLAETPAVYERVPFLLTYAEEERTNFTMPIGLVIGALAVFFTYRKDGIERWAMEVASELAKVHWPDRDTVTNGTIVVIVVSTIATVYIGLLDRLWGFVTVLVYGT